MRQVAVPIVETSVSFPFSEDRIRSGLKKLTKARHGSTQGRLDSFFKVLPSNTPNKRKVCRP